MSLHLFLHVVENDHSCHEVDHFASGQQIQVTAGISPTVAIAGRVKGNTECMGKRQTMVWDCRGGSKKDTSTPAWVSERELLQCCSVRSLASLWENRSWGIFHAWRNASHHHLKEHAQCQKKSNDLKWGKLRIFWMQCSVSRATHAFVHYVKIE